MGKHFDALRDECIEELRYNRKWKYGSYYKSAML